MIVGPPLAETRRACALIIAVYTTVVRVMTSRRSTGSEGPHRCWLSLADNTESIGRPFPLAIQAPNLIHGYVGPRVRTPNGTSIGSAVSATAKLNYKHLTKYHSLLQNWQKPFTVEKYRYTRFLMNFRSTNINVIEKCRLFFNFVLRSKKLKKNQFWK